MSTSVRTPHTRIPSVKSTSTNNYPSSSINTSAVNPASSPSPKSNSHITPGRKSSYTITFGTNNMGMTNGGVGASPGSSTSPSSVRSNKVTGSSVSLSPGSSGGSGGSTPSGSSGSGFRLRSLLPFGPNKNPTPISPTVSPSGPSNASFGGLGNVRKSMTLQRERKLSGSGSGPVERKDSPGQSGLPTASKTISHFGFKGSIGKGKGKAKMSAQGRGDGIPVISIDKQHSGDGRDGVDELGVYAGSKSMDARRASSDTIVSGMGAGRHYQTSRSRSIDWSSGARMGSSTSVPELSSNTGFASQIRLTEEIEVDQNGDHESQPYSPYAHSSSSTSTIPNYLASPHDVPSDSPDPLLLQQDSPYLPLDILPTGSSHDHPIDLSTIIEADSSGISKHLPSATSSEASTSASNSRAQSEEPQPFPTKDTRPSNSFLNDLNSFLQPPIQAPPRSASLQALKSSASGSSSSLTPSSGVDADASASLGSRSPSRSPLLGAQTPSPTLFPPLSPFAPPENSSSTPAPTSPNSGRRSHSPLASPFEPNLDSNFGRRRGSESPDYMDDSALELSMTEVDKQVRDAIRSSVGSAGKNRMSGGSTGGLSGPRGWLEDADARIVDGDEEEFEDSFLDAPGEESRIEENEVQKILDTGVIQAEIGGARVDRTISTISVNFDNLDPALRTLLSPNRLTPGPKKPLPTTNSSSTLNLSTKVQPESTSTSTPVPSSNASAVGVASTSVLSSPWNSGNGSATIIAPTPTVPRSTGIASIRTRKDALGVDLNVPGPSKFGLKTPSPTPEAVSPPLAPSTSSSSTSSAVLAKPPPLPLPSQIETGGTGIVAAAKSALLGRRPAVQSSLPRLKTVVKQEQGPARSTSPSTTVVKPASNDANANASKTAAETRLSSETGFGITPTATTITSTSTTTIPSTTISSISTSTTPCPPSTSSSPRRRYTESIQPQPSSVPVEVTPASPPTVQRTASNSSSGSLFSVPPSMRGFPSTAPPSPLSGAFAVATSTPVVERSDRRAFVDFDEEVAGGSRFDLSRTATLGRAGGVGTRARMALSTRSPSPSSTTVSSHSQKLTTGLELRRPISSSASTSSSQRRIASGDYPVSRTLDPTRLSPGRAQFQTQHGSPEMQNAIPAVVSSSSMSFWKGRHRRRSMSVGTDPRAAVIANSALSPSHSASANATRGFLAASRRRETGSVMSLSDRPGTSLSGMSSLGGGTLQRERGPSDGPFRERKSPMMEWIGPRTAKAFRAAGLLDFDAPMGSASPSEFGIGGNGNGEGFGSTRSHSRFSSLRSPSRMTHSEFGGGPAMSLGKSSGRRPSVGTSAGFFGLGPPGGSPSPTSVVDSPTSLAYRERDRETPTRSASTAPTSVSGASWLRDRDGERIERVDRLDRERERERERERADKERERDYEEIVALKEKHAAETSALLGALADSQRSARVLREEIAELRERLVNLERDHEGMEGVCEGLRVQNEEMKEDFEHAREEFEERLEEEIDRANRAEEENSRLRQECARLAEAEAEIERLRLMVGPNRGRSGTQPYANSPLRYSSRPGSPSFEFDSGEVEGFGAHEVEMSTESNADANASSRPTETKEFSTHAKSIHSPFLPPLTSSTSAFPQVTSRRSTSTLSDDDIDASRSRRISASSVFPALPANMSMLMLEDSIHDMDTGDRNFHDNLSYQSSDYSGFSGRGSPPSSPTIAIPLRQQEASSSSYKSHHPNASVASSHSPTTPNFSMMSGSPESLFLKPEHEMHLRDMDSMSMDFQLDGDDEIEEVLR